MDRRPGYTPRNELAAEFRLREARLTAELVSTIKAHHEHTGEPLPAKLVVLLHSPLGNRKLEFKPRRWNEVADSLNNTHGDTFTPKVI